MKPYSFLCGLVCALSWAPLASAGGDSVTENPAAASDRVVVGIAGLDGITVSSGETYITRGRIIEKLINDLRLPSGVIVRRDGSLILPNGERTMLQADQLLTLDGRILELPQNSRVVTTTRTTVSPSRNTNADNTAGLTGISGMFIGSDGIPFPGTITSPGVITKNNGQTVPIDGTIRTLTPGIPNVPMATVNPNGTVLTPAGTVIHPDGTVRTKDGTIISPQEKQGRTVRQDPPSPLTTIQPEATANHQAANPNPIGAPPTPPNGTPINGTNGAAPEHPGGPAPAGIYK